MNATIKVKYVGSNPIFTVNKVYPALAITGGGGGASVVILSDDGSLLADFTLANPDIELVSVTYPGEVQIYP